AGDVVACLPVTSGVPVCLPMQDQGQGSLLRFIREKWNRLQTAGGGGRSVPDKASTLSLYRI
ncbi:hypothetical protein KUCAC02_037756, partial [Chaenocephalus aceratus]